jgi:hypothetical protein
MLLTNMPSSFGTLRELERGIVGRARYDMLTWQMELEFTAVHVEFSAIP